MIDFPASPTLGQQFTAAGVTWTWDGTKWTAAGLGVAYLPLAGGTMLGPIVLAADPTANLQAATKQYVDGGRLGDNRIINGDMRIDQRNNGAGGTANNVYTADRWYYGATQTSKGTWQRFTAGGALSALGFGYALQFASSSAYASVASDQFAFQQAIEADMINDFAFGTSGAQPITLSFLVWCNQSGTLSGAISNYAATRSYPFTFSVPVASTWTKIAITIPGDTGGTWVAYGSVGAMFVRFDLGSGSTYRSIAGAWASGNYLGATGAISVVAINGAAFQITGVKLEIGSTATPFNHPPLAQALAACQRYYEQGLLYFLGYGAAANQILTSTRLPVNMRGQPTLTILANNNSNISGTVVLNSGPINDPSFSSVWCSSATATAAGALTINLKFSADAEL